MPLATCPTCATALRVPDGSAAAVRCPKCKTVFPPAPDPASPPAPPPSRPAFGSA
ncbi:MAG: zinc-ribbon domain-containing protein, partial [Gemmataceae bacterium]|nr:zinc-ribbon domain-containing protein [Gemmataceae bacterium]